MSTEYGLWDLKDLRRELRKRNARVSGRKRELVERLEVYDRNSDFGGGETVDREYSMVVPVYENYKDINKDTHLTPIRQEAVSAYLAKMNKSIDTNVKYIYQSKFLKYVRLASENGFFYARAECKAQMKKNISYKVDACVDIDGCIVECQCECAVGMGPVAACKHVCTVLYALQMFSDYGEIVTEETCTQNLQTFHQTKPYKGSPIKATNLPLANDLLVNFDPRPREFRNLACYQDTFRNVWLNHPKVNTLPVSQLFPVANTLGIDKDHDYLHDPLSDMWLKNMNITEICDEDILKVESHTCGQSQNPIWFNERCKRIHSSNFGRICKATEKTNFGKLANNLTTHAPQILAPAILHGKCYESVALHNFQEKFEFQTRKCGIFVSKTHPYLAASPDAVIDGNRIVEVKCPYSAKNQEISEETVFYLKNVNGHIELDKSHDYYYQIQGQLFCSNRTECIMVIYTIKDLKTISIQKDQQFIDKMLDKLEPFFVTYFKTAVLNRFYYHI